MIFNRIRKNAARKLFEAGKEFWICPVNLRPQHFGAMITPQHYGNEFGSFDALVNASTAYNCINSETGRYPAFYVAE